MRALRFALLAFLVLASFPVRAVQPDEMLADPQLEARARALSAQLRCMVCQNESIDDSGAPLARDLRLLVRDRLKAGESDEAVKQFLVSRYGDFILLKPPFTAATLLLWGTPVLALLIGSGGMVLAVRRRRTQFAPPAGLSEAEKAKLKQLVEPTVAADDLAPR